MSLSLIVPFLVIVFLVAFRVKIAAENERFAIHVLGRFDGFKGPGPLFKLHGVEHQWTRIRLGERGVLVAPEVIRLHNRDLPISTSSSIEVGEVVTVSGFAEGKLLIEKCSDQRQAYRCEKCGHDNLLVAQLSDTRSQASRKT